MTNLLRNAFPFFALAGLVSLPLQALEVTVTVENLAPAAGGVFTPVWVGFQDGSYDLYDLGAPASAGLERIAEDGNPGPLSAQFLMSGAGLVDGVVFGPGAPPVFFPGQTAAATFDLDPAAPTSRYFSYASMVIPSNDAFFGNDDPLGHPIFDGAGNFLGAEITIYGRQVLDAGTEVNDEVPANTAFFGQMAPDTGVVEGGTVGMHPGLLPPGSGGILDDPAFAAADFTRPGYRVARITVTARPGSTIRFPLSGTQVVPPVATPASGVCTGVLAADQSTFELECVHDVADVTAAHIHLAAAGENGPVIFDLGAPESPIRATWSPTVDEVGYLLGDGLYVQVHSQAYPPGELRGQIDGCFDGPVGLCLGDRFQVTATWEDFAGQSGSAVAKALSDDSGTFYFFDETNAELLVKVLDACSYDGYYWVFAAGVTNVGVEIEVEDTLAGSAVSYASAVGETFAPILDTRAFATCP